VKLTYNVLCLDDKIKSLDDTKQYLTAFNNNVGIETKYTNIEVKIGPRDDPDDFWMKIVGEIEQSFANNTFDMILVDLHMGALSGADVIDTIRKGHTIFRPIIFYSAGEPSSKSKAIQQLNDAAEGAEILGKSVFITSREDLYDRAASIFNEMHTEEHKVNNVRGLLMDRVSEFDASVGELVQNKKLLSLVPGDDKPRIASDVIGYLRNDLDSTQRLYDRIRQLRFEDILKFIEENPKDISTYRKGYILKDILRRIEVTKELAGILSEGIDGERPDHKGGTINNLRGLRNEYGHVKADNLEANHTIEKCIHIRKEARRQLKNIDDIHKYLKQIDTHVSSL
jgi:CheY-like chemotaxis protein